MYLTSIQLFVSQISSIRTNIGLFCVIHDLDWEFISLNKQKGGGNLLTVGHAFVIVT